jgi:hypothetical protein
LLDGLTFPDQVNPMDSITLFLGVVLGAIGMGYLVYGKKQQKGIALLSGLILCIIPYFSLNTLLIIGISILVMALPFFVRY